MATKAKTEESRPAHSASSVAAPDVPSDRVSVAEQRAGRGECVVDDGTMHMGRATPGARICSAHAIRYHADGTPRGA